ncbi:coiled-coil domain-containing protein 39-like isoform X2 [Sitophilus oryzae]|uniref:Coiled-coil domain-containing protein 39 n=1 Tax=Sitophilus oryzae TaxID=7048 RepID=A0A6J2XMV3_SITOR|nr:coiled-coil domain-containing protein 39-like isoform X2 [Sitophilus oryzae]
MPSRSPTGRDEKMTNYIATDRNQLEILQNKVENHLLIYDIGRKQIVTAKKCTQEKQVEENLMNLRINYIEKAMTEEEQRIFNLQKLRLTLDQAMKERQLEIDTKKTVVLAQKRNLEEDKGRLKGDISLRKVKLEQMKKKYHIELMSLGKDDDGQPFSITHFKIKHAQDKFMLQQQGDELDNKIKVAEKEIVAMENTLKMVNLTNIAFKNNLSILKDTDKELLEMKTLENILKEHATILKQSRKKEAELQKEADELKRKLEELEIGRLGQKETVHDLELENMCVENQEKIKEEQLHRAEKQVRKILKSLRDKDLAAYDFDLEIRHLKSANSEVTKKLYIMTTDYPDVAPNIIRYTAEENIDLKSQYSLSSLSYSTDSSCRSSDTSSCRSSDTSNNLDLQMHHIAMKKVEISFNNE